MLQAATAVLALVTVVRLVIWLVKALRALLEWGFTPVKSITIHLTESESVDGFNSSVIPTELTTPPYHNSVIPAYDPCTMQSLGDCKIFSEAEVREAMRKARAAQSSWAGSSFAARRRVLRTMLKAVVDHQTDLVRVACRDSGKTKVDAYLGEIITTCEKLRWTISDGERWLAPEHRSHGNMMLFNKSSRVEYIPFGLIAAIVPFNYPIHNVLNPLIAAVFSGNAIIIKTSEYASWSVGFMRKFVNSVLQASGCPEDLVQIVTGDASTGRAVTQGGVDKIIFVGSTDVGRRVMAGAAESLTPVVLELGGKDAFIVCDDVDIKAVAQTACRGVFQNMGQNCTGAERMVVHQKVYDAFCREVSAIVSQLRTGPTLQSDDIDCGAIANDLQLQKVNRLVEDARKAGGKVLNGGVQLKSEALALPATGHYYAPTVVSNLTTDMLIAQEEVFGPVMCIFKASSDDDAVRIANACPFGLGCSVFSNDVARARAIGRRVKSGMCAVNDFAVNYLCQCLPFGGIKESGFDRFAGPEGLRGMCYTRSIAEDIIPFMRNSLPPALQYPLPQCAPLFCNAMVRFFYGSLGQRATAVVDLLKCTVQSARHSKKPQ